MGLDLRNRRTLRWVGHQYFPDQVNAFLRNLSARKLCELP
jgi:hypothetical protein